MHWGYPRLVPSHQICCDPKPVRTDLYRWVFPLLFSHYADCLLTEVIGVPASHRKPAITRLLDLISAEGSMPWSEAMSATKPEYEYANEHVSAVIHTSGSLWWIVRANNTGESGTPSSQPIEHLLRMFVELLKLNLTRTPKQTDCFLWVLVCYNNYLAKIRTNYDLIITRSTFASKNSHGIDFFVVWQHYVMS